MSETVIQVRDVSMHFNLMEEKVDSIKEYFVKLIKGKLLYNDFIALNHVSFDVKKGISWGSLASMVQERARC